MLPLKLNQSLFKDSCLYFLTLVRLKIASILFTPFSVLYHHFENSLSLYNDYSFLCVTIQAGGI